MNFNDYQAAAKETAVYSRKFALTYPSLGLAGESGEVCEKIKKVLRDNDGVVSEENREQLKKELGDVLWYVATLASDLNLTLDEIAVSNIEKLLSRKNRGVLSGSGDNR